jgi:hypothetical protein
MAKKELPLSVHAICLLSFASLVVSLWMLPVLLAGFLYTIPTLVVLHAQALASTGIIDGVASPLAVVTFRLLAPFIEWENSMGWSLVTCIVMAASMIVFWWNVRKLFDARIAWMTIAIYSFMPITWLNAVSANGYAFAQLFLFLGFAFFLHFANTRRLLAIILLAICFGLTFASAHAFITFLPWMCLALLWHNRKAWKKSIIEITAFLIVAYIGTMLPMLPNALHSGSTIIERIQVFLPSASEHGMTPGHLYPDNYAYTFLREELDARFVESNASAHFLTQQQNKYVYLNFGVGDLHFIDGIQNGFWLFLHTFPELLVQEYLGGAFLWIFILVGMVHLYGTRRSILFHFVSLWFLMEFLLRFVLHFGRTHLMDIGWGFALFTAVGAVVLCDSFSKNQKRISTAVCCTAFTFLIVMQLTQSNRKLFARLYSKSTVPQSLALKEGLSIIPKESVVAHPRKEHLFYYSDRNHVSIHPDTIDILKEKGRVRDPFDYYGITHIFGYDEDYTNIITSADPSLQIVSPPEAVPVSVTPVTKYILHLIR